MVQGLRIALAGLGTVGCGVLKLLKDNADLIERRTGRKIEVIAISARNKNRDRGIDLSRYDWVDDVVDLPKRDDIDLVIELIGGSEGPALELARACLKKGIALITANKAMIAHHGMELAELAESSQIPFAYEAAVAGGIPIIKGVKEGAAANEISQIFGILNGTSNFILTTMEKDKRGFEDVLAEAQALGYAEADPTFDIEGIDAAHKLAILSTLAFGTKLDFDSVKTSGIQTVTLSDMQKAAQMGYKIRLIGQAKKNTQGLFQKVSPCLVPCHHPLAQADGSLNAVVAQGNQVGRLLFEGAGAGAGPTASAVVADLVDIARGGYATPFGIPVQYLEKADTDKADNDKQSVYIRLSIANTAQAVSKLVVLLADADISLESLNQQEGQDQETSDVILVTKACTSEAIENLVKAFNGLAEIKSVPVTMDILNI
ncbi:homoserine dehydrogenase [Zymomonas mobilis subsp. mobilis ZM4 = ATCC 31821]|uniref:Homoserine dehydrogenase n=1 Tax=Zymomonas mobilis subsp. mobilis (strain ATCC 31821 / ZM4 / CP4) TaxID=264203 RepID=Q5NQ98_ZYMMO|nr:homoserine dehydrogenase [Zymomonas mobilis]AAV89107.1 Homoserine dehydrogenase [Zymomonas mobilis subsp. mobilis ZM4 = ATCC 31821]AVZ25448.1 homoserine dehydrogenase [Zymomonas mobilis subsp. mobilis]AVZ27339.1 homoserine dehydrogenase [Zymomonas mobilis subsp. mobilis]AVZ41785.1 homoserine dehydrogenase [Zymomonas mobilis subsp. mobilis ZM4 = ATCC 31821]UBQ08259.1 homoserine dehydrogenase [Zymomonas mobilis]